MVPTYRPATTPPLGFPLLPPPKVRGVLTSDGTMGALGALAVALGDLVKETAKVAKVEVDLIGEVFCFELLQ